MIIPQNFVCLLFFPMLIYTLGNSIRHFEGVFAPSRIFHRIFQLEVSTCMCNSYILNWNCKGTFSKDEKLGGTG